jgi:cellulose synthase (UDP-forming)
MSSAALLLTGPFPTLTMMWFFPRGVYPHNYIAMLPALAAALFAFPMLTSGWRLTIYRVCLINSCCHLYAIWFAIRGRVADWVPTGASGGQDLVPRMVSRILRTWIVVEQVVLWSSIALRVHEFGWRPYWATFALGALQLYMLMPLMTRSKGVRQRKEEREEEREEAGSPLATRSRVMAGEPG